MACLPLKSNFRYLAYLFLLCYSTKGKKLFRSQAVTIVSINPFFRKEGRTLDLVSFMEC